MCKVSPHTGIVQPVNLPNAKRYHEFIEKKCHSEKCHSDFEELTDQELAASRLPCFHFTKE